MFISQSEIKILLNIVIFTKNLVWVVTAVCSCNWNYTLFRRKIKVVLPHQSRSKNDLIRFLMLISCKTKRVYILSVKILWWVPIESSIFSLFIVQVDFNYWISKKIFFLVLVEQLRCILKANHLFISWTFQESWARTIFSSSSWAHYWFCLFTEVIKMQHYFIPHFLREIRKCGSWINEAFIYLIAVQYQVIIERYSR
jgi:hypothetical protein